MEASSQGKKAADHLASSFADDNNIKVSPEQVQNIRETLRDETRNCNIPSCMQTPITPSELEMALSKLKMKKLPGTNHHHHQGACPL